MEAAQYVNEVGKLVNDSTKYSVYIDDTSVMNVVLIDHLQKVLDRAKLLDLDECLILRLEQYIHCMKKEMNFYASQFEAEDCILTELGGNIKLE